MIFLKETFVDKAMEPFEGHRIIKEIYFDCYTAHNTLVVSIYTDIKFLLRIIFNLIFSSPSLIFD